jgi:hypothetical protein
MELREPADGDRVLINMTILRARPVVVDSATLNKLAEDRFCPDKKRQERADAARRALEDDGWVPVVTLHHVAEIVQHHCVDVATRRLDFLREFRALFYLRPMKGYVFPGTAHDVFTREVRAVASGANTFAQVVAAVRDDLLGSSAGKQLIASDRISVEMLRGQAIPQHVEAIEIASIARADPARTRHLKLKHFLNCKPRSVNGRNQFAAEFCDGLVEELQRHGDKRLSDTHAAAQRFTASIFGRIAGVPLDAPSAVQQILARFGLTLADVDPEMTIDDLGWLTTFCAHLRDASAALGMARPLTPKDIDPDLCPSWRLSREVLRRQNTADRTSSSNLNDAFLVGLAFYVEAIEVDKRTYEGVRQVARNDAEVRPYVSRLIKSGSHEDFVASLHGL